MLAGVAEYCNTSCRQLLLPKTQLQTSIDTSNITKQRHSSKPPVIMHGKGSADPQQNKIWCQWPPLVSDPCCERRDFASAQASALAVIPAAVSTH
jgi:hypothetical protein